MAASQVLFRGASVIDGSGKPAAVADLRVVDGRVRDLGRLRPEVADAIYDVDGLSLAPGFIDAHTHADCLAFLGTEHDDLALANLRQGVTTQVCGNCGFSPFPIPESAKTDLHAHLLPALGPGTRTFASLPAWREAVDAADLPTNLVPLVGHGSLRAVVMGFDDRPATEAEMSRMEEALDGTLRDGAFGFSTGLIYSPGTFAPTSEIIRLGRVAARHKVPYATHMRNETDRLEQAVAEAIAIGTQAGVGVHISHHKAAGRSNWGRTSSTLARLDQARNDGLDVTADVYPYTAGSTALHALLPAWVQQGGTDRMLERLRDPGVRSESMRTFPGLPRPGRTWSRLPDGTASSWPRRPSAPMRRANPWPRSPLSPGRIQ